MTVTESATSTNTRLEAICTDVIASLTDLIRRHQVTWEEYGLAHCRRDAPR